MYVYVAAAHHGSCKQHLLWWPKVHKALPTLGYLEPQGKDQNRITRQPCFGMFLIRAALLHTTCVRVCMCVCMGVSMYSCVWGFPKMGALFKSPYSNKVYWDLWACTLRCKPSSLRFYFALRTMKMTSAKPRRKPKEAL